MKNKLQEEAEEAQKIILEINEGKEDSPCLKSCIEKDSEKMKTLIERLNNKERSTLFLENISNFNPNDNLQHFKEKLTKIKHIHRRNTIIKVATSLTAAVIALSFFILNQNTILKDNNISNVSSVSKEITVPILIIQDRVIELTTDNSTIIASEYATKADYSKVGNTQPQKEKNIQQRLIIPRENTYTVLLPDGTEVMLNAGGELSYPSSFDEMNSREVVLKGEAFFNVTKGDKPFIVKTSNGTYVKVYGTQFNVNAKNPNEVTTILIEGSVGFGSSNDNEVKIKPNQMIVWNSITNKKEVFHINPDDYLSWRKGLFEYVNSDFNHIIDEISSWYGVEFNYDKTLFSSYKLNMSIDRRTEINDLLTIIEEIAESENIKFIKERQGGYSIIK